MRQVKQYLLYVVILGVVLNLFANMIWKYIPVGNTRLDVIVSAILIAICAILLWDTKRQANNEDSEPITERACVRLETFTIDQDRCKYSMYRYDPSKPFWPPQERNETALMMKGKIDVYGKVFNSLTEVDAYRAKLLNTHNHPTFDADALHTIFFDRLKAQQPADPNYPVFYVVISNNTHQQIVIKTLQAIVERVNDIRAAGSSHTLPPVEMYTMQLPPEPGVSAMAIVPAIKIAADDSAAFSLRLIPTTEFVGRKYWLMRIRIECSNEQSLESERFLLNM